MLRLINRTIHFENHTIMVSLYKSIVRPTLKTVPQYVNKLLLERIQHRFTRLFPELKNLQYEERLRELGL